MVWGIILDGKGIYLSRHDWGFIVEASIHEIGRLLSLTLSNYPNLDEYSWRVKFDRTLAESGAKFRSQG